ncbi:hypothetical protein [Burkholderia ubonensis]|uniref:hypothetical protein n=1 Tax=Burkholderia ubonensis TaxID=101571 RepID=UPI000A734A7D|nr:hypothetical protein [Burkholderia ubonensis]
MTGSHTVDLLSSGFVVKTASSETFNGKLKAEVDQIRALHDIYPEFMVPVLHDGLAAGRQFYILEKKDALPLSEIVFDERRPLAQRRMILRVAQDRSSRAGRHPEGHQHGDERPGDACQRHACQVAGGVGGHPVRA